MRISMSMTDRGPWDQMVSDHANTAAGDSATSAATSGIRGVGISGVPVRDGAAGFDPASSYGFSAGGGRGVSVDAPLRAGADSSSATSYRTAPSLAEVKAGFAQQRARSAEKLFDLLTQIYPEMDAQEARMLALKF